MNAEEIKFNFKCYECSEKFDLAKDIIKHLKNDHKIKEKINQIKCVSKCS